MAPIKSGFFFRRSPDLWSGFFTLVEVTGLVIFWVAELKRAPHASLSRVIESPQDNGCYSWDTTLDIYFKTQEEINDIHAPPQV
jgi:hypothetical protein